MWEPSLSIKTYAMAARFLIRFSALRVASGFRTVSYEAIGVISGTTPLIRIYWKDN